VTLIPNQGAAVLADTLELRHATLADNASVAALQVNRLTSSGSALSAAPGTAACGSAPVVLSAVYNWFSDASCALPAATNRQASGDFLLGPVADNGGPVQTRAPAHASALINAIPASACSVAVDARGVTRPQGPACDIGAVEQQLPAGLGNADLALAFVNPPATVTAGLDGTWRLRVDNRGPAAALPAVRIEFPPTIALKSATPSGGAQCSTTSPALCVWTSPIAAGGSATIELVGSVAATATGTLSWHAQALAPALLPPLADDETTLSTPISVQSGLAARAFLYRVDANGRPNSWAGIRISNNGPSTLIGTTEQPITATFRPAPGVQAVLESLGVPGGLQVQNGGLVGSLAPGSQASFNFQVTFSGAAPAQLGTVEVRADAGAAPSSIVVPVLSADVEIRGERSASTQTAGEATAFTVYAINHGPAPTEHVTVDVYPVGDSQQLSVTYSPVVGTFTPAAHAQNTGTWTIPVLAPGETAILRGVAQVGSGIVSIGAVLNTSSAPPTGIDFNFTNESVGINVSPALQGTADVQIESLALAPGANANERIAHVTITNAGPAPAVTLDPNWKLALETHLYASDVSVISVTRKTGRDWTCWSSWPAGCVLDAPFPAGASASFEIVLRGTFNPRDLFSTAIVGRVTPDPNPNNNARYIALTGTP
ncbi:MAG TPA: choice-of-anchor Q domain-containing protein, partial [Polyangiaceae bacterium]|nr:choice-of-anchor Q domain-containing protein [Polyangiaceae bacterium]